MTLLIWLWSFLHLIWTIDPVINLKFNKTKSHIILKKDKNFLRKIET